MQLRPECLHAACTQHATVLVPRAVCNETNHITRKTSLEQAATHPRRVTAGVKVSSVLLILWDCGHRRLRDPHLVASCRTWAAEMLGSTAGLAAGWLGTSEAGARGRLEEITASRPQTQTGLQACSAEEPSDSSPISHSWRCSAGKLHTVKLQLRSTLQHHWEPLSAGSMLQRHYTTTHHRWAGRLIHAWRRTFVLSITSSDHPSQVCQPCWLVQVPSDSPEVGRPGCSHLPGSVGFQLSHLLFKLLVLLGNGDI